MLVRILDTRINAECIRSYRGSKEYKYTSGGVIYTIYITYTNGDNDVFSLPNESSYKRHLEALDAALT